MRCCGLTGKVLSTDWRRSAARSRGAAQGPGQTDPVLRGSRFSPMASRLPALIVACLVLGAGTAPAEELGLQAELPELETEASEPIDDVAEKDPCELPPEQELLGLDWTRRALFDTVCTAAMWVDGFFGEIRYDEAAPGLRGRVSFGVERREDAGLTTKPRFRVRVPLPNLNKRLSIYLEREDETQSIEGRNVEGQQPVQPISTTTSQDSTQLGFSYRKLKFLDDFVEFRLGVRAPHGDLDYYARTRWRHAFLRTDATQWRFSETLFWRHSEGWGETTELDFEAKLSDRYFFRWYNSATWSQITEGVSWETGFPLYINFHGVRVVVIEPHLNGQTGQSFAVANYGLRGAYRQTLGRPWLFGEIYAGQDWLKKGDERDAEFFTGFILEVVFDGRQRLPRSEQEPAYEPLAPGETSPVR